MPFDNCGTFPWVFCSFSSVVWWFMVSCSFRWTHKYCYCWMQHLFRCMIITMHTAMHLWFVSDTWFWSLDAHPNPSPSHMPCADTLFNILWNYFSRRCTDIRSKYKAIHITQYYRTNCILNTIKRVTHNACKNVPYWQYLWLGDIFRENSRKVITPTRYLPWKCSAKPHNKRYLQTELNSPYMMWKECIC